MEWAPPEGWERLDSLLEGFEVYGPVARSADPSGPVATRCPQCGAAARFDVARGTLGCPFCGWQHEQGPEPVGREAAAEAFTQKALQQGTMGFGVDRKELGCGSCGAAFAVPDGALSATCPFCASPQVALREGTGAVGLRPVALLPFRIERERCQRLAREWLGQGWFHPDDLGKLARVESFVGIYVPYWTFSAGLRSGWQAEVGKERTEREYDASSGQWKTKTVVDWEKKRGTVSLTVRDLLVPGTSRLSKLLLSRLDAFELEGLVTYEPRLLAGFLAQTYDVTLPDAWEQGRHQMRERAREACMSDTHSRHVRNFKMTAELDDESWRHVLLPLWVAAYRYGDRTFVVLMDGAGGKVAGQKPVAWHKVWLAITLLLAPGVLLGLLGLPLLLVGIGAIVLGIAAVLLVLGGVASAFVYQHAAEAEAL
jgi:Zn finger protein HypA/HybF involved in hydrogenase expression